MRKLFYVGLAAALAMTSITPAFAQESGDVQAEMLRALDARAALNREMDAVPASPPQPIEEMEAVLGVQFHRAPEEAVLGEQFTYDPALEAELLRALRVRERLLEEMDQLP